MKDVTVRELFRSIPTETVSEVRVRGWVRTCRESKTIAFIELNDGSFFNNLQIVVEESAVNNFADALKRVSVGASVECVGDIVPTPEMKQPFEMKASSVTVLGDSPVDYPLQKKRHTVEYLRTIQHLRPRANLFQAVFRIRSVAAQAIHRFFHDRGFVYVHTPLITGSDCEGAGEMFRVTTLDAGDPPRTPDGQVDFDKDFFGKPVSLTVSGQLNAEIFATAFRNVYTFGPTFRAEISYTPRHAAEFWMIEPEIAFATLKEDMELQEDMIKYIIDAVLTEAPEELAFLNEFRDKGLIERLKHVAYSEFARVSYTDAIEILQKADVEFEYPVSWGCDL
ncbi:MAG: asparagine--tRNA ligase, partial [Clostridia bacterium]|nr:asparagine--tRNA ligase [Clostridia bacterium]